MRQKMLKYLAFSVLAVSLTGCASAPDAPPIAEDQYCYTDQTVVTENNATVNSQTVVQCSDNPLKRAKLVGVDEKNCRRWQRRDYVNGREKHYGGYICRDEQGNWRPLDQF